MVETREREVATRNGRAAHVGSAESLGVGIRVLAGGSWGFAATDDLTREGLERTAALALAIARSGAVARKRLDERPAVIVIVKQDDRRYSSDSPIGTQHHPQSSHQGIGRRQRV